MSQTVSASAQRPYGLARVCKVWRLSRATVSRHRQAANRPTARRRRPGPVGPHRLPDRDLPHERRRALRLHQGRARGDRRRPPRSPHRRFAPLGLRQTRRKGRSLTSPVPRSLARKFAIPFANQCRRPRNLQYRCRQRHAYLYYHQRTRQSGQRLRPLVSDDPQSHETSP